MRFARHRCNCCGSVFDCEPCKHTSQNADRVYCSEKCKEVGARDTIGASDMPYMSGSSGSRDALNTFKAIRDSAGGRSRVNQRGSHE